MNRFRILVVDDDPDVRYVVTSLLGFEFETAQACNGLDALEKIDRLQPDMLLMDINMPVVNGISCCDMIKRNPEFEQLPVIFLSASGDSSTRSSAARAGAIDLFEKPFETGRLIDAIKSHFASVHAVPSPKKLSIEQIRRIDATPLQAADGSEASAEGRARPAAGNDNSTQAIEPESGQGRQRRVFGRKKEAGDTSATHPPVEAPLPQPAPLPDAVPSTEESPLPRRTQHEKRRQLTFGQRAATPLPTDVTPPEPVAPKAFVPPEPSPAEILAQRRLSALGRVPRKAVVKPRVLVLVESPQQLPMLSDALRGTAEFLPLEDPVEAVALIARFQPDIVVMGIQEGGYSGLQIATMLRGNPRLAHTEVIFVQSHGVDSSQLAAAQHLSRNRLVRRPLKEQAIREALDEVIGKPGFRVREKNLPYGAYVKEVIRSAELERARQNKEKEKRAMQDNFLSLAGFMARELSGYREPADADALKGAGAKVHEVKG